MSKVGTDVMKRKRVPTRGLPPTPPEKIEMILGNDVEPNQKLELIDEISI